MLSRTADSLYWLARYVERAENISRAVLVGHWMASMARSLGNPGRTFSIHSLTAGRAYSSRIGSPSPGPRGTSILASSPRLCKLRGVAI